MIKKTLICTLLIVILYNIFIVYIAPPTLELSQHQWQENTMAAQSYVFSDSPFQNVIVGSSLSHRIPMDSLQGFYNLSFSGQSIFDGFKILLQKGQLPKRIFIETNVVLKPEDQNFTASFSNPVLLYGRKHLPSLRDGKQPMALASLPISAFTEKTLAKLKSLLTTQPVAHQNINSGKQPNELFEKLLTGEIDANSKMPSQEKLDASLNLLASYIILFTQKKVDIVLFEMPVNPKVCNLAKPTLIRNSISKLFPSQTNKYIEMPDCAGYKTTDGIHLTPEDAASYVHYFKATISKKGY